ncbi:MAG: hypothetical protein RLO17_11035 [Cyclobacteriaceae bacterium]
MVFLFLLNSIFNILFQEEPKAKFVIESNKHEILEGECVIITVSLLIDDENTVDLRFPKDLGYQLGEMGSSFMEGKWFFHNNEINNIVREFYMEKGVIYAKYRLIETALCPYDSSDIFFPEKNLSLIENQSKLIQLKSEPVKVKVKSFEDDIRVNSGIYSNHFYNMVGDFTLDEELIDDQYNSVGDTIDYRIRIYGEGNTFPIGLNPIDTSSFQILVDSVYRNDTIVDGKLRADKGWSLKLIPQKPLNDFSLSKIFKWKYYSLKEKEVKTLSSKESIWVGEKKFHNTITTAAQNIKRVIAIDISKTMLIEDYQPTRMMKAIEIANLINKDSCNAKLLFFSGDIIAVDSCRIEENPYNPALQKRGTAIGNTIWEAIQILEGSTGEREIILIGDGDETTGSISGMQAASIAQTLGIKIYCIGIGTVGRVVLHDNDLNKKVTVENTFRSDIFQKISNLSGGQYFYLRPQQSIVELINRFN